MLCSCKTESLSQARRIDTGSPMCCQFRSSYGVFLGVICDGQ
jgi:hypothetical protein